MTAIFPLPPRAPHVPFGVFPKLEIWVFDVLGTCILFCFVLFVCLFALWKYKWLDSHSYGAMWHLCCKHSEHVFYACRISLISGLLNEDLICWVGSWNCRGYSVIGICFRIFTGGCKQFCAAFECSFCRVIGFECIAPTAYDAVGDVMVWMAIRWEKCFWDFPETPSLSFRIRICFLSSGWW